MRFLQQAKNMLMEEFHFRSRLYQDGLNIGVVKEPGKGSGMRHQTVGAFRRERKNGALIRYVVHMCHPVLIVRFAEQEQATVSIQFIAENSETEIPFADVGDGKCFLVFPGRYRALPATAQKIMYRADGRLIKRLYICLHDIKVLKINQRPSRSISRISVFFSAADFVR